MKFYMACIKAYKQGFGMAASARVLIAENKDAAYMAAIHNCSQSFPIEQGYVIHQADVAYLCDENSCITLNGPDKSVYEVTLSKRGD